ncbi:efflux transporter outer membrane subunit [Lichenicoccus sp.]|uniref:efflux transporter outer membrane subunit n=1 Tax=Lichenicoccus sp. TaxID=2781899 RepID=UPI003D132669
MMRTSNRARLMLGCTLGLGLCVGGCMVGPDYDRRPAIVSQRFKELQPAPGWQRAMPQAAAFPKGEWWRLYNDPVLSALEAQVSISNQNVKVSEADYRQARAIVDEARASLFPTVTGTPAITRQSSGGSSSGFSSGTTGASTTGASTTGSTGFGGSTITNYQLEASVSWDLDVWGRIRRQIESDVASAQASAADLANATLSYQATLATDYFDLRTEDSLQMLLDRTVASYERSLQVTQNQYNAGLTAATPSALLQAATLLEQTRAEAVNVGVLRTQYEHAIAVLTGRPPAELTIAPAPLTTVIPAIPVSLPATLLQRRPDISAAERTMEEENALIGVEVAAFYPDISLSALYGWSGNPIGSLIQASNRVWSLGASASQILFEGGLRTASVQAAQAAYDAQVATYRQTVLGAFQTTEDDLSALRIYERQAVAQARAVSLSEQAVTVAFNEYNAGTVDYTTVVTSEATALSNEQTLLTIQQDRMVDSVSLIEQMGGGWNIRDLPSKGSLQTSDPLVPAFLEKN